MKKLLIVDDSITIIETILVMLKEWGIEADTAPSGIEAVELAKKNRYDLVILDIMMPKMDGNETLWHFERDKTMLRDTTPIIAMSSNDYKGAREGYISRGFTDYLPKPVTAAGLRGVLEQYNILK